MQYWVGAPHARHVAWPAAGWCQYVPSGHGTQSVEPGSGATVPAAHVAHSLALVAPARLVVVPAGHGAHASADALPARDTCRPAGHLLQRTCPV